MRNGGVLFLKLGSEAAAKSFDLCFNLRDKIRNDDVIYCGIVNYLLSLDADVIIEIRKMQPEDEVLKEILDLTLRKLNGEDISEEINEMEYKEERDEMKMLLDMLSVCNEITYPIQKIKKIETTRLHKIITRLISWKSV
ncbi:MAG: hypothetical protein U9N58_07585 [Thermodesulfobacteriota bacterium]|nr:hypothetical protein [Thermodesulfobacteriota bacterium]